MHYPGGDLLPSSSSLIRDLAPDFDVWWGNADHRDRIQQLARVLETEPSILAASAHLVAVVIR